MRRQVQGAVLLLIGGMLLKISWSGDYLRYVKPGALWLLVAAGVAMVVLAVVALLRPDTDEQTSVDIHSPDHSHDSRVGWLLLVPTLVVLGLAPPALGQFQAQRSGTALPAQNASDLGELPPGDPVRVSLTDYATRAIYDDGHSLAGRTVTMSGFVIAGDGGQVYLARMVISCCAADARPIKVGLTGDTVTGLDNGQWLEVDGTYTDRRDADAVNGLPIPYLAVTRLAPIAAPASGYES